MTERDFESEARAVKVETITRHLLSVHGSLKEHGVLPEHSHPFTWVQSPSFPFDAMRRASGAKHPCSPVSKAMILEELRAA